MRRNVQRYFNLNDRLKSTNYVQRLHHYKTDWRFNFSAETGPSEGLGKGGHINEYTADRKVQGLRRRKEEY